MWTTTRRLFGVLMMFAVITAACGSTAETATEGDSTEVEDPSTEHDDHDDGDHADEHDHDSDSDEHAGHEAKIIEVAANTPVPAVEISLVETDTQGLFDLSVTLSNFTITPEAVDGDPVDNEGHMHLLIDGVKVERFTVLEHQVEVPEGQHLVEVELNANNHAAYAVDGVPIRAGETVTGSGETSVDDGHSHSAAGPAIEEGLTMADADLSIEVAFAAGDVVVNGGDRVNASVGDIVAIMIDSDVAEQAHLHGYDLITDVGPEESSMILFTAKTPGKFEIEFETSGVFIAELVVS